MRSTARFVGVAVGLCVAAGLFADSASGQDAGQIVAWGRNNAGQCNVPAPNSGFGAIAGGAFHSLGLKGDGSLVAWGWNYYGQCTVPAPNADFIGIVAGWAHSLGLKADGSVVAWGRNDYGECNVPAPNSGFVAVAAGGGHSLSLKADGSILAWGDNRSGECNVPAPNYGFVAVAGGLYHSLGLKADGSLVAWGNNTFGQCNVPGSNSGFVAAAAGERHSLGLKADGSIVAWGDNGYGQCSVPAPNCGFVAVAAGVWHSAGLRTDGSIVAWGWNDYGQGNVPSPNTGFTAIAAGGYHSLGLKALPCENWTQRNPLAAPPGRGYPAPVYDSARGVTVIFGGWSGSALLNDTWEWDGSNWTQRTPATVPAARSGHAMVYDSGRGVTVFFGGGSEHWELNDTSEWNGTNWTQRTPPTAPSARRDSAMAYDSARGVTVLFGGAAGGFGYYLGDTWEWNGSNWMQRTPTTAPSIRGAHAMAYDSARGVTVLFGGGNGSNAMGDTWEWDGTNWMQRMPATSPSARVSHPLAYDSARGVTVLFGGGAYGELDDTWEWDGTNWIQRFPAGALSGRSLHGMAYDSGRGVTVLFGGGWGIWANDTWEYQVVAPTVLQQPISQTMHAGGTAVFNVLAQGFGALTYQWRKDGVGLLDDGRITGSTTPTLTIDPVEFSDAGSYDVLVTNDCGSVTSDPATLTVEGCSQTELPILYVANKNTDSVAAYKGVAGAYIQQFVPPGGGGLDYVNGIAVDRDGDVYVSGFDSNTVIKFDGHTGQPLLTYSVSAPVGVLLAEPDRLLVASYNTDSVLEFNRQTGALVGTLIPAPGDFAPASPGGLLLLPSGNILVASERFDVVLEYDGQMGAFLRIAAGGGGLHIPTSMLMHPDGSLLVACYACNEVLKYAPNGTFLGSFVPNGSGGLQRPYGIIWSNSGSLLVVSGSTNQVLEYNGQTGAFVRVFAEGGLNQPRYMALGTLCDPDCNGNAVPDQWEIDLGTAQDCNHNGIPDECDIANATSQDCNADGVPDECQTGLAPDILTPPAAQTVFAGQPVTMSVVAGGAEPLHYQWRRNGQNLGDGDDRITGITTPTLMIDPTWLADSGSYDVIVSNTCGTATSAVAALTVNGQLGDLNCDGVVNFDDINPFVLLLTSHTAYEEQYPNCDWRVGDCNNDGWIDFDDINPFIAILSGGGSRP